MAKEAIINPPVKVEVKPEVKVEKPQTKVETAKVEKVDYSSKTVAELREIAKDKNLLGYSSLKKAELIELIENN
ncbi:MAG: Rho termination factor N-terminal domain-containing protein [Acholeplasmataceae bacterium]